MRRRLLPAAIGALVLAVVPASAARAEEGGQWTAPLTTATTSDVVLAGRFTGPAPQWAVLDSATVTLRWVGAGELPDGCTVPAARTVPLTGTGTTRTFNVPVSLPCNGDYVASARAVSRAGDCPDVADCPALPDLPVAVAAPGPAPTALAAATDDERPAPVELSWRPPADPPADSLGTYRVERSADGGPFTPVATTPAGATSWQDDDAATTGGSFAYRVVALRRGPGGQPVASSPSSPAVAHVAAPPAPGGDPGDGGTGGTGGTPGTGGTGGTPAPGWSPGGSGGGGSAPAWSGGLDLRPPGVAFGGGTPSTAGSSPLTPPTTADTGYRPTLDYGDVRAGDQAGTITRVPEVAAPVSRSTTETERFTTETAARRVLLPVAAAMALLVGAAQLLHLARKAKATPPPA
jgi:hypothetical protein